MSAPALWRVRPYLRPYAWPLAGILALSLAGSAAVMVIPLVVRRVIDGPIADGEGSAVVPLAAIALALGLADAVVALVRRRVQSYCAIGVERQMRNGLYAHLQRLPVGFHDQWQSGQLLSRAMSDLATIRRFIGFAVVLVVNVFSFAMVFGLLLHLYAPLAVVTGLAILPVGWLCLRFEQSYIDISRRIQDQHGDLSTLVEESAVGIRVIKAFGRDQLLRDRFSSVAGDLQDSALRSSRLKARFWPLIDLVPSLALAAVLLGGAVAVSQEEMTLGTLVAFTSLVLMLVWPVESMGWILATGQEASTAAARVFEVFDTEPAIVDRPSAIALVQPRGHISFEGVGFRFPGARDWALHGVDLELAPGETLGVVGMTGSGKTALAQLVPRLYDVTEGRITFDGHDIRDLGLDSLRRHVNMAFDEPFLFSASVAENLRLGWPDASDDQLAEAIEVAQAGFVYRLPWGLDTRVGEQGLTLSGGQRQRLALARAIVGHPSVLVLDDPLSALDVRTEALVEEALHRVLAGTTALLVVHRASTLALADRVAFLEDGTVTAVGSHADLMANVPAYRAVLSQEAPDNTGPVPAVPGAEGDDEPDADEPDAQVA